MLIGEYVKNNGPFTQSVSVVFSMGITMLIQTVHTGH